MLNKKSGFLARSFSFFSTVAGIPLTASILTTGVVCTFYTSLVSKHFANESAQAGKELVPIFY